jgi:glycosyltransferase involved in cell wall biosynthesis
VSPVYNEEGNVGPLYEKLVEAMEPTKLPFEIILVDDGSTDQSPVEAANIALHDDRVRLVQLQRNYGQTAAMGAGVDIARGEAIVMIDADLQNDPADIPMLLDILSSGYDVVSGWRKKRQDSAIRRVPSKVANRLISKVTTTNLNDYGCSLKAYRASYLKQLPFYGDMHRFLPAYLEQLGARTTEVPVRHYPRVRGRSKYGISRTFKVLVDLLTIRLLGDFRTKPMRLFGYTSLIVILLAFAGLVFGSIAALAGLEPEVPGTLFTLAGVGLIGGLQLILAGFIAEILSHTYFESQNKRPYVIRRVIEKQPATEGFQSFH